MGVKRLTKLFSLAALGAATMAATANAAIIVSTTYVESRSGGKNFTAYSEGSPGFPNSWAVSSVKSSAPGTTPGIGSRFNSASGVGGSAVWFQVAPTLPTAGATYDVYATVTTGSGNNLNVTSNLVVTDATGLPASTNAFSVTPAQPGNLWNLIGTMTLAAGDSTPIIRFEETANSPSTSRFYADAIRFDEHFIPEPATFILAGLGLVSVAFAARRRSA